MGRTNRNEPSAHQKWEQRTGNNANQLSDLPLEARTAFAKAVGLMNGKQLKAELIDPEHGPLTTREIGIIANSGKVTPDQRSVVAKFLAAHKEFFSQPMAEVA